MAYDFNNWLQKQESQSIQNEFDVQVIHELSQSVPAYILR
jgi:hypothetical protein